jgi:hypothetical protein
VHNGVDAPNQSTLNLNRNARDNRKYCSLVTTINFYGNFVFRADGYDCFGNQMLRQLRSLTKPTR